MRSSGPPCGWVLAYIEVMMSEYHMSLPGIFRLSVHAGFALLEARSCRLAPSPNTISFLDRAIIAARAACRREILKHYRLADAKAAHIS